MDSKIPKPSGIPRKPATLFDFNTVKKGTDDADTAKKPLTGKANDLNFNKFKILRIWLNLESNVDALAKFKFTRSKSPDVFRPNPKQEPKLRRSKSAVDLRKANHPAAGTISKAGTKRFQPTMENIPSKFNEILLKLVPINDN